MDKKNLYSTIVLVLLVIVIVVLMVLSGNSNNSNNDTNSDSNVLKTFFIAKDGPIPAANVEAGNIKDKIVVIESKYCGACKEFLKTIEKVEQDTNYVFHKYDVSESEQRSYIEDTLMVDFQYTPTTIIGGDAYIGFMDENTLLETLSKYALEQK
ncbi:MAG: hypothetical protein PHH82_02225 [Candidatus ainarchaeum sp.]|nr:hypothetical protein [Candidatus ainarchaeum sp.]